MRRLASVALGTLCLAGLACSVDGTSSTSPAPAAAKVAAPIINGTLDTGHPAVVGIFLNLGNQGAACTGTIFQTDAASGVGWVLTAGHCVTTDEKTGALATASQLTVIEGNDYQGNGKQHAVVSFARMPGFKPPEYDFAVLKISGVTATTPTMPLITAAIDGSLASGSTVEFVGFGQTSKTGSGANNSKKYHVNGTLGATQGFPAVAPDTLAAPFGPGTTCNGDSGGPWLYASGGQQYVAAVTSVGDNACAVYGVGAHVTFASDFIAATVSGSTTATTCGECQSSATGANGACNASVQACAADAECTMLLSVCGCASGDTTCENQCFTDHNKGNAATLYSAIISCLCDTGCKTECAMDALCTSNSCGFSSSDATCNSCLSGSCCDKGAACAKDAACTACITMNPPAASCSSNAAFNDFSGCLDTSCSTQCGGGGGTGGSGSGGSGAAGAGTAGTGPSTGTGGTSTGTAGTSTGTAGTSTGTAGAAGKTTTGTGGTTTTTGAGGSTTSTGQGGATASAGSTGTTQGVGGDASTQSNDSAGSGSSGGCSVDQRGLDARGGLFVLLGLGALIRRRRAKAALATE